MVPPRVRFSAPAVALYSRQHVGPICGWLTSWPPTHPLPHPPTHTHCFLSAGVLEDGNPNFGYNAATGKFEDLMAAGIIDPAKVSLLPSQRSAGRS